MLNKGRDKYTIQWIYICGSYQICTIHFIPWVLFLHFLFIEASISSHWGVAVTGVHGNAVDISYLVSWSLHVRFLCYSFIIPQQEIYSMYGTKHHLWNLNKIPYNNGSIIITTVFMDSIQDVPHCGWHDVSFGNLILLDKYIVALNILWH